VSLCFALMSGHSDDLHRAFLVYLISPRRSMADVLAVRRKPLRKDFVDDFEGMTEEPTSVEQLEKAREAMITELIGGMPATHREFLNSSRRASSISPCWGFR
jgi:hypothetical protein